MPPEVAVFIYKIKDLGLGRAATQNEPTSVSPLV
jgi:hypothetical protein